MIIIDLIKDIFAFLIARIFLNNRNIWLISERGTDARDNGYWFYRYLRESHPEIEAIYVITPISSDYKKVASLGKTVAYNSFFHGVLYYCADFVIGTHPGCGQPKWRAIHALERRCNIALKGKRVFLQHGITKDMIYELTADVLQTDLFICGAKPEYDYILEHYGFSENIVKYTGFARFDNLEIMDKDRDRNEKIILLMPTWRHQLSDVSKEEFLNSQYFHQYQAILNSSDIFCLLERFECRLIFYPHYEIQKWIDEFSSTSNRVIIAKFEDYDVQELLKMSDILVTDYSSVFFDMAYMKKETIFFQFDYEEYRKMHYQVGYFNYSDSFGPVVSTGDAVLNELEKYLTYGVDEQYTNNMNNYFVYRDKFNRDRIFNEMKQIDKNINSDTKL